MAAAPAAGHREICGMARRKLNSQFDYEFEYGFSWAPSGVTREEEQDYLARYAVVPGRAAGRVSPAEPDTVEIGDILRYELPDPFSEALRGEPVAIDEALRDEIAEWLGDNREAEMLASAIEQLHDMRDDAADAIRDFEEEYGLDC